MQALHFTKFSPINSTQMNTAAAVGVLQNRLAANRLDLAQEAALGLVESHQRFDPTHGTRLTTFAFARMRGRAQDAVRAEARYLHAREKLKNAPETKAGLTNSQRLDLWRTVDRVAPELPTVERAVLDGVYRQDLAVRDVAEQGRWSEDQLQRAHKRLLARLRGAVAQDARA